MFHKIRKSEQIISTSFFTFTENNIYLKGINSENKIVNETLETNRAESFISHAVATDVWHSANIIKKNLRAFKKFFLFIALQTYLMAHQNQKYIDGILRQNL